MDDDDEDMILGELLGGRTQPDQGTTNPVVTQQTHANGFAGGMSQILPAAANGQIMPGNPAAAAAPPPQPTLRPLQAAAAPPAPAQGAAAVIPSAVASFLDDEDDYDEPDANGLHLSPPAPAAPVFEIQKPTFVGVQVQPAAEKPASELLALPALGPSAQGIVLQLSEVFGMRDYEVEKYLDEPLVAEEPEGEKQREKQIQLSIRERRAKRLQRLQQLKEQQKLKQQSQQQPTPKQSKQAVVELDDESALLRQMPDNNDLLRQYQQERNMLLLSPSSPSKLVTTGSKAAAGLIKPVVQIELPPPPEPSSTHVPAAAGATPVQAEHAKQLRITEQASQPIEELPLDPQGQSLVHPIIQGPLSSIFQQELFIQQAPTLAHDLNHPNSVSDPLLAELDVQLADDDRSDEDEVIHLLGVVPSTLSEPANAVPWEQQICWGSEQDIHDNQPQQRQQKRAQTDQPENLDVSEQFQKSVQSALEEGKHQGQGSKPQPANDAGVVLAVPTKVFGQALHPQALRLGETTSTRPPTAEDSSQPISEVKRPPVVGDQAPLGQQDSMLHKLTPSNQTALALPEVAWDERVLWDATKVHNGIPPTHSKTNLKSRHTPNLQQRITSGTSDFAASATATTKETSKKQPVSGSTPSAPLELVLATESAIPPEYRTPLLLDLNDPNLAFTSSKVSELSIAAAVVQPPHAKPKIKYGPPVDPNDEVAKDLARFNVSKDAEYGHGTAAAGRKSKLELRDASAQKAADVKHAMPALTLQTFPTVLTNEELVSFHRPRGQWHPSDLRGRGARRELLEGGLALILHSLTGRQHGIDLNATFLDKPLSQVLEDPTIKTYVRFPDIKTSKCLFMSPNTGSQIDLGTPLQELVDEGRIADIALVFPHIKLLPTKEANSVPTLESKKPLVPPAAFSKRPELTPKEGHVILMEFMEERPALIGRPGMGAKLMTYYKKKDEADGNGALLHAAAAAPQQGAGEVGGAQTATGVTPMLALPGGFVAGPTGRVDTWRVGSVQQLNPDQESPFFGPIKPGAAVLSVETLMYRAPAKAHTVRHTDFLLVRSNQGVMSLREITGSVFVGQQQPHIPVPDPLSKPAIELMHNLLVAYVLRELRKTPKGKKNKEETDADKLQTRVKMGDLMDLFPLLTIANIRSVLVDRCGCQLKSGASFDDPNALYGFADEKAVAAVIPEGELRKIASPDQVAAYENGRAAEERLMRLGLQNPRYLANVHPDLVKLAIEMLPLNDPAIASAAELLEHEITAGLPWRTTDAFIRCVAEQRGLLNIDMTAGDPTGRGHAFSYVLRCEPLKAQEVTGPSQPETGTITGSENDLRKLTNTQAAKILLDFGITQEVINATTDRWKRIDMVRKLCTAAGSDGVHSELTRRYTRVMKYSYADHVNLLKQQIPHIWEAQLEALGADAVPPGAAAADAMLASVRKDRLAAINKGITTASQRAAAKAVDGGAQNEDQAEYLRMQREGFFGSSTSNGGPAAQGSTVLEAKNGDKRVRRIITWTDASGEKRTREIVFSDKTDMHSINTMCKCEHAFGTRVLGAVPPESRKVKTVVPARLAQQELTRGRGKRGGGGRGGRAAATQVPSSIKLPSLRGGKAGVRGGGRKGRPKAHEGDERDLDEAGGADGVGGSEGEDDEDKIPYQPSSRAAGEEGDGAAKLAKKKIAKKPPASTLRCKDCGGVGHEAGDPACHKAYVNPDDLSDMDDDGEGMSEAVYRPTTTRAERGERRRQLAAELSEGPSPSVPRRTKSKKAAMADIADTAGTAYVDGGVRAKRKSAQAAVASFRRVGSEEEEIDLGSEEDNDVVVEEEEATASDDFEISNDEEEDEEMDLGRSKSRRMAGSIASAGRTISAKRTASTAGFGELTGFKRTRAFQQVAATMTAADGQKTLSSIFKECISAAKKKKSGKIYDYASFTQPVSKASIEDYNQYVPAASEMWLDKILGKAKGNKYTSREALLGDVYQIVNNAISYNTPGRGRHGCPPIIEVARGLYNFVQAYLDNHGPAIEAAETAIQNGVTGLEGQSGGDAKSKEDLWLACDRCQKWRIVPQDMYNYVNSLGDGAKWYCEQLPGVSCSTPSEWQG